jgi:predicted RNA binding protein YcfA (HicA-like mRNA interferase family)
MPSPIRFAELRKELERAGYRLVRISGSHHIFEKAGDPHLIVVPVHQGKVKPVYGRKIHKIIGGDQAPKAPDSQQPPDQGKTSKP